MLCHVLSPKFLQRGFLFICEFHHNYLMYDVIITSYEIFELRCNFHYCPRPFIVCLVFIRLACIYCKMGMCAQVVRAHTCSISRGTFTSCSVTQQGMRSEGIHPFLAKSHRLLYAHVHFLTLRTFQAGCKF